VNAWDGSRMQEALNPRAHVLTADDVAEWKRICELQGEMSERERCLFATIDEAREQLAAAQAEAEGLRAERERFERIARVEVEGLRAGLRAERQRTWQFVEYAAGLEDENKALRADYAKLHALADEAASFEGDLYEARSEQEALRVKAAEMKEMANKNFANMLDAWTERDAARADLVRMTHSRDVWKSKGVTSQRCGAQARADLARLAGAARDVVAAAARPDVPTWDGWAIGVMRAVGDLAAALPASPSTSPAEPAVPALWASLAASMANDEDLGESMLACREAPAEPAACSRCNGRRYERLDGPSPHPCFACGDWGKKREPAAVEPAGPCGCFGCLPRPVRHFVVCQTCGNKRCPHAAHHDNACTNSNEPDQPGSRYASAGTGKQGGDRLQRDGGRRLPTAARPLTRRPREGPARGPRAGARGRPRRVPRVPRRAVRGVLGEALTGCNGRYLTPCAPGLGVCRLEAHEVSPDEYWHRTDRNRCPEAT
jgi:hypothetical protein